MKCFTYFTAGSRFAHQDTGQCCTSGSGSLAPHRLFPHWRDEGHRTRGTAASALHHMSGCMCPSRSKDSSSHELQHRTTGKVLNNGIHLKSRERLSPGTGRKRISLLRGNFQRQMVQLLFGLEVGCTSG